MTVRRQTGCLAYLQIRHFLAHQGVGVRSHVSNRGLAAAATPALQPHFLGLMIEHFVPSVESKAAGPSLHQADPFSRRRLDVDSDCRPVGGWLASWAPTCPRSAIVEQDQHKGRSPELTGLGHT
jgi:hypothetical protein